MHPASTDEQQSGRKRFLAHRQLGDDPLHNGRHSGRKASITSPQAGQEMSTSLAAPAAAPATASAPSSPTTAPPSSPSAARPSTWAATQSVHLLRTRETLESLRTPGPGNLRQPASRHARPGHPNQPPVPGSNGQEFRQLRWQPYEPVRQQPAAILKAVNRRRRYAGYPPISPTAIPTMRRITTVFADPCSMSSEAA
jgi:hypothetical protein